MSDCDIELREQPEDQSRNEPDVQGNDQTRSIHECQRLIACRERSRKRSPLPYASHRLKRIATFVPPKPLEFVNAILGACSTGLVTIATDSNSGSSSVMFAETGVNPSSNARQQKAASIAPASDNPWPVSDLVLLMYGVFPSPKTRLIARISAASPPWVEVACAL